jgi:sugar phosphate permease
MITGSAIRLMTSATGSIWWWYLGHIVCLSSQAYLKNPVTKLASNWFGDKERGLATAIGIVSGPVGILISTLLIMTMFDDQDKIPPTFGGNSMEVRQGRFEIFIAVQAIITIGLVTPALFLIREKPPSPPTIVATKKRPV